jgi:hypothetical protein
VEEGVEILTGVKAGKLQSDGTYSKGTLFRKVDERLLELAEVARKFGKEEEGKKQGSKE